ncbi:phosphotransferase family protein [Rhizobium leguminosarum]|uniref:phosphotransferase family protein n=1 Tax=Rhizobium leguminosarum TaxID=384 RepID=UPI00143F25F3|nr:aminoglycoside phosphotransferase family protein [Rhizobium leguminosarum]
MTAPTEQLAADIAAEVTGHTPSGIRRFTTGTSHYVFEALFANRLPVVVRIGEQSARTEMEGAVYLSGMLRPQGVPLPQILAENALGEVPWMVLQRLPGTDLGTVIANLTAAQLERIAISVSRAQTITARTGSAGRYGYAVQPEQAPYSSWSQVLESSLNRSRQRIMSACLFDPSMVDVVRTVLSGHGEQIDRIEPIPFLHDTTTKNVIVTQDGSFSGIVDVDNLCFGDPRYPAALTLAVLLAYGGPTEYVSAWLRHAEQPDDPIFRLYVSLFLLDLMAEHGQVFNGNERTSAPEERASLRQAFQDTVQFATR